MPITPDQVEEARRNIAPQALRTPLVVANAAANSAAPADRRESGIGGAACWGARRAGGWEQAHPPCKSVHF
ncbi:MAG: hypothetical protein ACLQU1_13410 [Bryobacteraceae bacterium]